MGYFNKCSGTSQVILLQKEQLKPLYHQFGYLHFDLRAQYVRMSNNAYAVGANYSPSPPTIHLIQVRNDRAVNYYNKPRTISEIVLGNML